MKEMKEYVSSSDGELSKMPQMGHAVDLHNNLSC